MSRWDMLGITLAFGAGAAGFWELSELLTATRLIYGLPS